MSTIATLHRMRETQRLSLVIVFCFQLFVSIKLLNIFSDKKIVFSSFSFLSFFGLCAFGLCPFSTFVGQSI